VAVSPAELAVPRTPVKWGGVMTEPGSVTFQALLDAGLLHPGQELRIQGRRANAKATITSTGAIKFEGVDYRTPSGAASAVRGTARNGWIAWRVRSGQDGWVTLSELRQRLQN
jgi:Restriction Enzyme Adenine Methylase Associated